jgi:glutathione S-transferase
MSLTIYGDPHSGNCLKVKWTADRLGLQYQWVDIDVLGGGARTAAFRQLNPAAQVPTVVLADGRTLAQSNAIILHLAEGSSLIPADSYLKAKMHEWMFWEQYSHEPYVAVRRFHLAYLGKPEAELDPRLEERGHAALARMESWLSAADYLVGEGLSLADIALVAYTRVAHEGGFDIRAYPGVDAWVKRVERDLAIPSARKA